MSALAGHAGTFSLFGVAVTELTDLNLDVTREDYDATDLGDWMKQHVGGPPNVILTGNANYLSLNSSLSERLRVITSGALTTTGIIVVNDSKGSTVVSGNGVWLDGGMTMPQGIMTQPFRVAMNTWTTD